MSMIRFSTFRVLGVLTLVFSAACGGGRSLLDEEGSSPPVAAAGLSPCADGLTQCGQRNVSLCYDLATSKDNCGACGRACAPGIACQAGTCQHTRCTGPMTFETRALITLYASGPSYAFRPALGDFDNDGFLDLAGMPIYGSPTGVLSGAKVFKGWSVLYGAGDGTFSHSPEFDDPKVSHFADLAADLDGDGVLDIVTMRSDLPGVSVRRGSKNRDAPFGEAVPYLTNPQPENVILADLDSDGHPDMVAAVQLPQSNLEHWRNLGNGRFEHQARLASPGEGALFLQAVDWNHDGAMDLVFGMPNLHLRLGRGDGTFDPEVVCGLSLGGPAAAPFNLAADLDHDNIIDLVGENRVFLDVDACNPRKVVPLPGSPPGIFHTAAQLADMNGDGNLDILNALPTGGMDSFENLGLLLGDGKGNFSEPMRLANLGYPDGGYMSSHVFLVGDVNRDGRLDIIAAYPGGWEVLLNTCQ
jgi:hypothetical protein